jgi:hypothetical protein
VISVSVEGEPEEAYSDIDLFACLLALRGRLEARGLLLCCQGARRTVFLSGMTRQMGNGRLAYAHRSGERLSDADLVEIFAPADHEDVVSVAEQKAEVVRIFRGPAAGRPAEATTAQAYCRPQD